MTKNIWAREKKKEERNQEEEEEEKTNMKRKLQNAKTWKNYFDYKNMCFHYDYICRRKTTFMV